MHNEIEATEDSITKACNADFVRGKLFRGFFWITAQGKVIWR